MSKSLVRARALVLIVLIWGAVGFATGFLRPLERALGIELPWWVRFTAIVAISAGGTLMLVCGLMLSTRGIGTLRGDDWFLPRDFIAHGPFRFVRNPMSMGRTILMVGIALWHRSTLAMCAAAILFVVFHLVVILVEEPGLERRFGDGYRTYRLNVPRWVPRLTPWVSKTGLDSVPN